MRGLKRIYLISLVNRSHAFYDFFYELSQVTPPDETGICFLHPQPPDLMKQLEPLGFRLWQLNYSGKWDIPVCFVRLLYIFYRERPLLVHTHLFDASLCGLPAAWLSGVKKRFHTRHHASYHHDYFPRAVKYDRFINNCSTHIFSVSETIRNLLIDREGVLPEKVTTLHHGFNLSVFGNRDAKAIDQLRSRYRIPNGSFVVGCISRYTEWKGLQYTIEAFENFKKEYSHAFLLLANAGGDYRTVISQHLSRLPKASYVEIEFESDIASLYALMDVFVHVPIDPYCEAFGQVYVESLASGVPLICTLSGIANEFTRPHDYFRTVNYCDAKAIEQELKALAGNTSLALEMANRGRDRIRSQFGVKEMLVKTLEWYGEK